MGIPVTIWLARVHEAQNGADLQKSVQYAARTSTDTKWGPGYKRNKYKSNDTVHEDLQCNSTGPSNTVLDPEEHPVRTCPEQQPWYVCLLRGRIEDTVQTGPLAEGG